MIKDEISFDLSHFFIFIFGLHALASLWAFVLCLLRLIVDTFDMFQSEIARFTGPVTILEPVIDRFEPVLNRLNYRLKWTSNMEKTWEEKSDSG